MPVTGEVEFLLRQTFSFRGKYCLKGDLGSMHVKLNRLDKKINTLIIIIFGGDEGNEIKGLVHYELMVTSSLIVQYEYKWPKISR